MKFLDKLNNAINEQMEEIPKVPKTPVEPKDATMSVDEKQDYVTKEDVEKLLKTLITRAELEEFKDLLRKEVLEPLAEVQKAFSELKVKMGE